MCAASLSLTKGAGLSRQARYDAALDPATAPLDERTPLQWMARAPGYAKLLNYFDTSGTAAADWSAFWASDPAYMLAQMTIPAAPHGTGSDFAQVASIHSSARRFNTWLQDVRSLQFQHMLAGGNTIEPVLESLISSRLSFALKGLLANTQWKTEWAKLEAELPKPQLPWAAEWQFGPQADPGGPAGVMPSVPITLTGISAQFDDACATLSQQSAVALKQSMAQATHPAHSTLFLSFVKLFGTLQEDMNGFTGRHLDYYYQDVLRLEPSPGTPDRGMLVFALASNCASYLLPAGSTVTAGQDSSGQAVLYATDQDVMLNQASIGALRTVTMPLDSGGMVSAVYAAPVADSQDGLGAKLLSPGQGWPTFGAVPAGGVESPLASAIGFLIASPALALQQGVRQLCLHLQFSGDTAALQDAYFAAVNPAPAPDTEAGAPHREPLPADAFLLYVSGAAGWMQVTDFSLVRLAPGTDWLLRCVLPASFPAVAANAKLEPSVAGSAPMLKLVLNPKAVHFAYSYFCKLLLSAVHIRTKVRGLAPAQMSNSTGAIAAGKPFNPFGNAPLPGMSWSLTHPELAAPALSWARVDLSWLNLPLVSTIPPLVGAPNGFAQYYQGYQPFTFANGMFNAGLARYSNGSWESLVTDKGAATFSMFAYQDGSVLGESSWFFRFAQAKEIENTAAAAAEGTVRAAFDGPSYGFGQAQYPTLFAAAAIQNIIAIEKSMQKKSLWERIMDFIKSLFGKTGAALKSIGGKISGMFKSLLAKIKGWFGKPAPAPAPSLPPLEPGPVMPPPPPAPVGVVLLNPPYVPTLKTVQISYKSVASVALDQEQFYHVHPFGMALPVQASLFPIDAEEGNLYIGLAAAVPGQSVSMHFELRELPASSVRLLSGQDDPLGSVTWRYLANNAWQDFAPGSVASATSDLGVSGIVTLQLPADIGSGGSVMGDTGNTPLCWVAASIGADPSAAPATIAILPQAATVSRITPPSDGGAEASLPPLTITATQPHIAAVKSVTQPYATSGGVAAESTREFRIRVSERLRHKQRASQMRDYEQIVLGSFPSVAQVKCVGPNNSRNFPGSAPLAGGQLVLVLAPPVQPSVQLVPPFPRPVLLQVAESVSALASACVDDITVRNVLYELLQVHAVLGFQQGVDVNQCSTKLNQLLCDYLAPAGSQLDLGVGAVSVAAIASLVRQQPYVSRLDSIAIWQSAQDGSLQPLRLGTSETARPRTPWSALVTAPNHVIESSPATASGQMAPVEAACC